MFGRHGKREKTHTHHINYMVPTCTSARSTDIGLLEGELHHDVGRVPETVSEQLQLAEGALGAFAGPNLSGVQMRILLECITRLYDKHSFIITFPVR